MNLPIEPTQSSPSKPAESTFYDQIGGEPTFRKLTQVFYQEVAQDEYMRVMYPEEDLGPAEDRLCMFLMQYWGGPKTYSEKRGHPRLRMRHMPFAVNPKARDHWLAHMRVALDSINLPPMHYATFWDYLERAAHSLVNTFDDQSPQEKQATDD